MSSRAIRIGAAFALGLANAALGAQADPAWTEPFPPFRIAGNLYYIGSRGLASYLIATPQGHILINSDLEANVPMLQKSIEQLGFRFTDVKVLLISHAHWDHDAGSAMVKGLTGAKYMVMDADVPVVETGGRADFHYGGDTAVRYPPAKVDRVLHDGDTVRLGDAALVARLTPGHTKGCTTWTMQVRNHGRTLDAVIVGSPGVNTGYRLVDNVAYPQIAADYERTFRTLRSLPADVFLGAHGSYFGLEAKFARMQAGDSAVWVDPAGYRQFVARTERAFRTELARQRNAQPREAVASGIVFGDANGNGIRDAGERGIARVVVSNQDEVTRTDASGTYRLPRRPGGILFVSVPDGYQATGPFWHPETDASGDFALRPVPRVTSFTFIHASDTHLSEVALPRMARFRAIVDSVTPDFTIVTGDLVKDALRVGEAEATRYFDLFQREIGTFRGPVWTVPGNHDNFGIERDKSHVSETNALYGRAMYHHVRGPDYYSFTYGGVHFVGLNSVDIDDQSYYGHVDSVQVAWLKRDLATIPASMPVVTFQHIPFFTAVETINGYMATPPAPSVITVRGRAQYRHVVSNAREVIEAIGTSRYHIALGGHMHVREQIRYAGIPTRFFQTAAVVGPGGSAPLAFPSGVTVYHVRDGTVDDGTFVPIQVRSPH